MIYCRAIAQALAKRDDETWAEYHDRLTKKQKAELKVWRRAHRWHPHQPRPATHWRRRVRHNAATELRKEFGIETAQILLGHSKADVTQVYAEEDGQKAVMAMLKIG